MILNKIELSNFRQFYGQQEIIFAKDERNITVILGAENGSGKTGIFRALIFSLFGEVQIAQDNPTDSLHIVNLKALNENDGGPTESWVSIEFKDGNQTYQLKRSITAIKRNKIDEKISGVELRYTDEFGNFSPETITDEYEIQEIIESIITADTKDFFFFDGEQIDTLAKTDSDVKKEVKNGIIKLLKIDELEKAIDVLSALSRNERSRITSESKNLDLTNKQNEIETIEEKIKELTRLKSQRENEQLILNNKINQLQEDFDQNSEVNDLIEKRNNIEDKVKIKQQLVSTNKDVIKDTLLDHGVNLLLSDQYIDVNNYLDQVAADQDDLVSITAINKTLNDQKCVICGNDLDSSKQHRHNVELLKNNFKSDDLSPLIAMIQGTITDFQQNQNENESKIENSLIVFNEVKEDLEQEKIRLENLNNRIKTLALTEENLADLQEELESKIKELGSLKDQNYYDEEEINRLVKNQVKASKEFETLMGQNKSLKLDQEVLKFVDKLEDEFTNIFGEYSNDMRIRLSDEATNIFKKLISRNDRDLISQININDKYEIEVIGWDGINITPDISQGQRHIVSLSFITALSRVAIKNFKDRSFPLFMDTPFGRISGENRDQLINNIPKLTSQWILLVTDTELTREEEKAFKETNKLGHWYRLNKVEKYHSEVEEMHVNSSIATRG